MIDFFCYAIVGFICALPGVLITSGLVFLFYTFPMFMLGALIITVLALLGYMITEDI